MHIRGPYFYKFSGETPPKSHTLSHSAHLGQALLESSAAVQLQPPASVYLLYGNFLAMALNICVELTVIIVTLVSVTAVKLEHVHPPGR